MELNASWSLTRRGCNVRRVIAITGSDIAAVMGGVAVLLTAATGSIVSVWTLRRVHRLEPMVEAIDNAVNRQPEGTEPMVETVKDIDEEQGRVAAELEIESAGVRELLIEMLSELRRRP